MKTVESMTVEELVEQYNATRAERDRIHDAELKETGKEPDWASGPCCIHVATLRAIARELVSRGVVVNAVG